MPDLILFDRYFRTGDGNPFPARYVRNAGEENGPTAPLFIPALGPNEPIGPARPMPTADSEARAALDLIRAAVLAQRTGLKTAPVHTRPASIIRTAKLTRAASVAQYDVSSAIAGDAPDTWLLTLDVSELIQAEGDHVRLTFATLQRNTTANYDVPFRGYVYDQLVTHLADHAAFNMKWDAAEKRRGRVEFAGVVPNTAPAAAPNTDCIELGGVLSNPAGILLKPVAGKVYIGLVAMKAYVPAAGGDQLLVTAEFEAA